MEAKLESNGKESGSVGKIMSPCDVEALKKCLEENKGDQRKCQSQIEAFRTSCSIKKPNTFNPAEGHIFLKRLYNSKLTLHLEEIYPKQDIFCLSFQMRHTEACREWGFFSITNHGIPKDLFRKLCTFSSQIFNLPLEAKLKAGPLSLVKTYTPHFIASPFFESLRVDGPDFFASAQSSSQVLLYQSNCEFSETLQDYGSRMTHLSNTILEMVLKCMGANFATKFRSEFSNCHGYLRINNYSPPKCINKQEIEGLGMHTDMSCITILYQDEIGGLQVKSKEGLWTDINPQADTLIVNIGDLVQAWSNGKFRSSEHRVVLRENVNRVSLAFFWCFEDDKVIFAPKEVVGAWNSRLYKPFVCADYVKYRENNEKGKFEKVGFTVNHFAGTEM